MQTHFLQLSYTLNNYRTAIIMALVLTALIAFFIMPSAVVEAGKAVSTGG